MIRLAPEVDFLIRMMQAMIKVRYSSDKAYQLVLAENILNDPICNYRDYIKAVISTSMLFKKDEDVSYQDILNLLDRHDLNTVKKLEKVLAGVIRMLDRKYTFDYAGTLIGEHLGLCWCQLIKNLNDGTLEYEIFI